MKLTHHVQCCRAFCFLQHILDFNLGPSTPSTALDSSKICALLLLSLQGVGKKNSQLIVLAIADVFFYSL